MTMEQAPNFSKQLHHEYMAGKVDNHAITTLQKLKEKLKLKGDLFEDRHKAELEQYREWFPDAWAQVENLEAYQALTPQEQAKVMFEFFNNGKQRPENPIIRHLDN